MRESEAPAYLALTGRELAMLCDAVREHLRASEASLAADPSLVDSSVLGPLRSLDRKVNEAYACWGRDDGG